jgi:signal transduction histidine kinase
MQLDIYRMVQELVNNITKHAHATEAKISIFRRGESLILLASDNGIGSAKLPKKTGVGIINIRSRAELYGGTVLVSSKPGKAYKFTVTLPCFSQH